MQQSQKGCLCLMLGGYNWLAELPQVVAVAVLLFLLQAQPKGQRQHAFHVRHSFALHSF
jgi:hypothetical protein